MGNVFEEIKDSFMKLKAIIGLGMEVDSRRLSTREMPLWRYHQRAGDG